MSLITMEPRCYRQKTVWWILVVSREAGGKSFYKTTHVLHAEHHGGVSMLWACACYVLKGRLHSMNHMNLFAILKPLKNLKALFRKSARATLQESRDHA